MSGFLKLGEAIELNANSIQSTDSILADPEITKNFKKLADDLNKIAPKANEFLYFSAVMMHAAEASALNSDGSIKLTASGEPVKVSWDKSGNTWKWKSNDKTVKAYKNSNGDIFPEEELLKAYKEWVGKPLCIDHKSSSVEHVRGVIVDTYYDRDKKRVIALCALDKKNYPDLARQVEAGYAASVSMGTAVGRAVCYDCGTVARTEHDFCKCMKSRSCYGEINLDLSPIELSIVVNGADPKAKIKQIIAAKRSLEEYLTKKESEIQSLSLKKISSNEISGIKIALEEATNKFKVLEASINDILKSVEASDESDTTDENTLSVTASKPEDVGNDYVLSELAALKNAFEKRLQALQTNFEKMAQKINNKIDEDEMSGTKMNKEAYFQGGGGVNEPTPKQPKYEVEPLNDSLRMEDRHMVGQMETGPVDGMHPGVDSAGKSELERKKMLARAEADERAERRKAALQQAKDNLMNKEAYFQGGGDVNEPTPGKPKYPKEEADKIRDKEDKHMTGQKPFPEVGSVDGLHPSPESADQKDELKRKQLLQRASLTAKFIKAANTDGSDNLDNSEWQVFNDNKLVLRASVKELSGGNATKLYDVIATKEYGTKILAKVRSLGFEKASALFKSAQLEQAGAPMAPAPAMDMSDPMAQAPVDTMAPPVAPDANGDPKDQVTSLFEQLEQTESDLRTAVESALNSQPEVGPMDDAPAPTAGAPVTTASLNKMRLELKGQLVNAMTNSLKDLKDHKKELQVIRNVYAERGAINTKNQKVVATIVSEALGDAKSVLADAHGLIGAYIKYARGTEALVKRAKMEAKMKKQATMDELGEPQDTLVDLDLDGDTQLDLDDDTHVDFDGEDTHVDGDLDLDSLLSDSDGLDLDLSSADDSDDCGDEANADDEDSEDEDENDADVTVKVPEDKMKDLPVGTQKVAFDLTTKSGRSAYRAKLAADAQKMVESDMPHKAHPKGGETTQLDIKPEGDLAKVETLDEIHDSMMDVAKAQPKVRKEAEKLQKLVSEGKLAASEVDSLVAHGLDAEVVKYWKQYFGEVDGGAEFASELLKEHKKAQVDEQLNTYKVKIARAYELANEMVEKGLLPNDRLAISAQADEIANFTDEAFNSLKKVVARNVPQLTKKASVPVVGLLNNESTSQVESGDLYTDLLKAFSGRKY